MSAVGIRLATHALIFFVRGAASDLKYAVGYFLTKDVTRSGGAKLW
jgi:hypothetical protein